MSITVSFDLANIPPPITPVCPDGIEDFCPTLGDSNLGDDYPSSSGWRFEYDDGKETKFVHNKKQQTIFIVHRSCKIGIDKDGNLYVCASDVKVAAHGKLQLLAAETITIQSDDEIHILAKNAIKICSDEDNIEAHAMNDVLIQAETGEVNVTAGTEMNLQVDGDGDINLITEGAVNVLAEDLNEPHAD